jgi:hypothetical protein
MGRANLVPTRIRAGSRAYRASQDMRLAVGQHARRFFEREASYPRPRRARSSASISRKTSSPGISSALPSSPARSRRWISSSHAGLRSPCAVPSRLLRASSALAQRQGEALAEPWSGRGFTRLGNSTVVPRMPACLEQSLLDYSLPFLPPRDATKGRSRRPWSGPPNVSSPRTNSQ